jgi:hypothetical protein
MDWVMVAFIILGGLTSVSQVGKPRDTMTADTAVAVVVFDIVLLGFFLATHGALG